MKIVKSSSSLLIQGPGISGLYKHLEIVGRISHRSEFTGNSKEFIEKLKKLGHWAVFDLGTVYLKIPVTKYFKFRRVIKSPYTKTKWVGLSIYITTNYRVILKNRLENDIEKFWCDPCKYHHLRVTSRFICSRNIANEIVRHRAFSFIQESTRYVNYSRLKYGAGLEFIEPEWMKESSNTAPKERRLKVWENCESEYMKDIEDGLVPGDARGGLSGDLKTELYMCGYLEDYYDEAEVGSTEKIGFFTLRSSKQCHPDLRKLSIDLDKQIREKYEITRRR